MVKANRSISRRDFLKQGFLLSAGLTLNLENNFSILGSNELPASEYYARNTVYSPNQLPIRIKPDKDASIVRALGDDEFLPWIKEVVGSGSLFSPSKTWVETPEGYIYRPSVQKVKNSPNSPVNVFPDFSSEPGMWVEVTVPFVNLELVNPSPNSPAFQELRPELWRLYYSQVIWVDEIRTNADGNVQYRINERYGSYGDVFWADAKAFRIITPDELAPINPN
jgi:hypothetical protein